MSEFGVASRGADAAFGSGGGGKVVGWLVGVSTVFVGLMAGLFFAYDISVMPGLAKTDDRTYVAAMQEFNAAIDGNGLFVLVFLLALVLPVVAAVLEFRKGRRATAVWVGVAALAYLVALVITFAVNIPLNNELADLGNAAKVTDFSVVERFKSTWVTTNILRTVLCTAALGCLVRACMLLGRR